MTVEGEPVTLPWGQVAGIQFRRVAALGTPVEGLLARVEWRSAPGGETDHLDFAEGAITAVTDRTMTVATPYSGILSIPRWSLQKVSIFGHGRRYVIDATGHHLGDELSVSAPVLDPPEPEGGVLERTIELAEVPEGPWFLILDVVQVVGEHNDEEYSPRVRNGELRTNVLVNGRLVDNLNRHIKTENKVPERVTIAIPAGLLQPGKNTIRLELTGRADVITGTLTSGSTSVTGIASTAALVAGQALMGTGIPSGTTIQTVNGSTTITLSANATATGSQSLTAKNTQLDDLGVLQIALDWENR